MKRVVPEVALVPVEVTATPELCGVSGMGPELVVAVAGVEVRVVVGTDTGYVASLITELRARC